MYFIRQCFNLVMIFLVKKMTSIKVTCCSCFIDQCICFCKTKTDFDRITLTDSDLFLKEKRDHCILNGPLIYVEYIIACFDCFTFQLWNLSIENIRLFDTVACRFTFTDPYNFGEEFDDDVFTGNAQFSQQNNLLKRVELEKFFLKNNISDCFFRQPKHKSCFTSMQRYQFSYFCTECKKIYCKFFEKDLHVFWS